MVQDNSGSDGIRKTSRKKGKAAGSNEGVPGSTEKTQIKRTKKMTRKMMEKTQDSTEFEPVHVASRPAVSKNKVKRNLWDEAIPAGAPIANRPGIKAKSPTLSGRALPGSSSAGSSAPDRGGSSGSSGSAGSAEPSGNKMRKRLRESAKLANCKTEEEDTIFQKVKGGQRPAVARMRSHKDRKSKERISKRREKDAASLPVKNCARKEKTVDDDLAPTRFEVVHAEARPAIVIEKPRKKSQRRDCQKTKHNPHHTIDSPPIAEAGETVATVEETPNGVPAKKTLTPEYLAHHETNCPESQSAESIAPHAKMVSVDLPSKMGSVESPGNCEESEYSQYVEEMDVPEVPGYQFEIWKSASKPKPPTTSVMLAPSATTSACSGHEATAPPKVEPSNLSAEPIPKAKSPPQKSEYLFHKY